MLAPTIALLFAAAGSVESPPRPAWTAASLAAPQAGQTLPQLAEQMRIALEAQDAASGLTVVTAMINHPQFAQLPAHVQAATWSLQGALLVELDREDEAEAPTRRALAIDASQAPVWLTLIRILEARGDRSAVAEAVTSAVQHSAAAREAFDQQYLVGLAADGDVEDETAFGLRQALFDYGWRWRYDSWIWLSYAGDLIERGQPERAAIVLGEVEDPQALVRVHGARRYDEAAAIAGPALRTIQDAMTAELTEAQAEAAAADAPMEAVHNLAQALFYRGRYEEALAVADAGLARPHPTDDAAEDWDYLNWLMNSRSRILMELGRFDEGVRQQEQAANRLENSGRNVSQQINLGWTYLRVGRHEEALAAVAGMSGADVSPYGVMQAVQVRARAAIALGRQDIVDQTFAYMAEHWSDAPGAYQDALACRGDTEAMAQLLIRRLGDPEHVDEAIVSLHAYAPRPFGSPFDETLDERFRLVAARPDVIAARDAVGRALDIPSLIPQF